MIHFWFFLFELFTLFILSKTTWVLFSRFIYGIFKSRKITIAILAFLFLPGTILHEFSHWIFAVLLNVKTGKMSLYPKLNEENLILGSVMIEKTDFIRGFIIGIAPVMLGLGIFIALFNFVNPDDIFTNIWLALGLLYITFEIGNTMFSSKKDMRESAKLLVFLVILSVALHLINIKVESIIEKFINIPTITTIFEQLSIFLLFPVLIDLTIILLLKIVFRLK